jgi:adenine deaminase
VVSAKFCSTHQAGLKKSLTGSIRPGYQADLIQVSCIEEMGDFSFYPQKVWISGKPVI